MCIYEGCKVRPVYNTAGETKGLYCATHKLEGMVDIKNKTCIHEGCKILPVYNTAGESKALYCTAHKLAGMVNVKNKTCKSEWCFTQVQKKIRRILPLLFYELVS